MINFDYCPNLLFNSHEVGIPAKCLLRGKINLWKVGTKMDTAYEYILTQHNNKKFLIGAYSNSLQRNDKANSMGLEFCALTANTNDRSLLIWKLTSLNKIPTTGLLTVILTKEDRTNYKKWRMERKRKCHN